MERQNDMEELSVNISYCPYCGSKNIIRRWRVSIWNLLLKKMIWQKIFCQTLIITVEVFRS